MATFRITFFLLAITLPYGTYADPLTVRYLDNSGPAYYRELIQLAMEATQANHGSYELQPVQETMTANRVSEEMLKGDKLNLIWAPAITQFTEKSVTPVLIPLLKGLSGVRIAIIQKYQQERFRQFALSRDLNSFRIGQEFGWVDVGIIEYNGVRVFTSQSYESLYTMLSAGRIGSIFIGAEQVTNSLRKRQDRYPNLTIDKNVLLYYPLPVFFFVSKTPPALASRLDEGLRILIDNGEMDRIYYLHFGHIINELQLSSRILFKLKNPYLLKNVPLKDSKLWLEPLLDR